MQTMKRRERREMVLKSLKATQSREEQLHPQGVIPQVQKNIGEKPK